MLDGKTKIGIDRIGVYVPDRALPLTDLAAARAVPAEKLLHGLGVHHMAVAPVYEDSVTLAANAAVRALAMAGDCGRTDPGEIGLLIVATESAVDHAKPVSIFVHELLGLAASCRAYEIKHACYGGTAALMTATEWIASGVARGRKALVVASDIAKYPPHSAGEPTQGAGAVAMVVAESPGLLALDVGASGVHAANVYDFWRPLDRSQALVDGKYSLDCYLAALAGAFAEYRRRALAELVALGDGELLTDHLAAILYHTPFPRMAWKAHRALVEDDWRTRADRAARFAAEGEAIARRSYAEKVEPSLWAAQAVGNTYTASLYLCLAALLERGADRLVGRRLGMFSYGSGSCAEFYSGVVAPGAQHLAREIGLAAMLERRRNVTVAEYERHHATASLRAEPAPERPPRDFAGPFFYRGTDDDRRAYAHV
ncbi:MAG TPA: hydroxymethylglutaryl-CoA synthase family protein [Candidatus Binatia bacterium]|nr:hydroxymethylglutaryl-CoA synthase family protein [Candidatus Binatia bacterium]